MYMYTKFKSANSNDFSFPLASAYRISTANISTIRYFEKILISFWSSRERSRTVLRVKDFLKSKTEGTWRWKHFTWRMISYEQHYVPLCSASPSHLGFITLLHYIAQPFLTCAPCFAYDLVQSDIAEGSNNGCTRNFQTRAYCSKQGTEIWLAGY